MRIFEILGIVLSVVAFSYSFGIRPENEVKRADENELYNTKSGNSILRTVSGEIIDGQGVFAVDDLKQFVQPNGYPRTINDNNNMNEVINDGHQFSTSVNAPQSSNSDFQSSNDDTYSDTNTAAVPQLIDEYYPKSTTEMSYLPSPTENSLSAQRNGIYTNRIEPENSISTNENDETNIKYNEPDSDINNYRRFLRVGVYTKGNAFSDPFTPTATESTYGRPDGFGSGYGSFLGYDNNFLPRPMCPPMLSHPYRPYPEQFRTMRFNSEMDNYYSRYGMFDRTFPNSRFSMRPIIPIPVIIYKILQPIIIKSDNLENMNIANRWNAKRYTPERVFDGMGKYRLNRFNYDNYGMNKPLRYFGRDFNSDENAAIHLRFIYKE